MKFDDITSEKFPYLGFNDEGHPLLYGDPELHEEMNLPENVQVSKDSAGIIHGVLNPNMAIKVV